MKSITKVGMKMVSYLPDSLYIVIKRILLKYKMIPAAYSSLLRLSNGNLNEEKVSKYKNILVIKQGYYDYDYFNVCFLNNVLSLCLKAISEGYVPQVMINDSKGNNIWEVFFDQPYGHLISSKKREKIDFSERYLEAFPQWSDVTNPEMRKLFGQVYNEFIKLNSAAKKYIEDEIESIFKDVNGPVLGVICRGTDYVLSRPKGHPIQPSPEEILQKAYSYYTQKGYKYIYLATEDSKYDLLFRERFKDSLLINKRQYYDKQFVDNGLSLIKDVHFDRENDEYYKGLEYLSSLYILAKKCHGLVAGNCGATEAAVFWNCGAYNDLFVYELGLY